MAINTSDRRYDIDALRVIAFSLLILYHVGMFYVLDWDWHVKSSYLSAWLQEPMRFTNQWRMSLLFVISGLALSFVWPRYTPWRLAARRSWRLGVPLLFGMAVIVAPQPYYEAVANGSFEGGFLDFWLKYLTFNDFPGEAYGGENLVVWTWNHLWYLAYLLVYTVLLAGIGSAFAKPLAFISRQFCRLRGPWLVIVPIVPLLIYGNVVFPHFPYINHALYNDLYAHALYGTLFFYGFMIGRDRGFWAELLRLRVALTILAGLAYASVRTQDFWVGESPGTLIEQLGFASVYINRWAWILVALAWSYRYLNRPSATLSYASRAIFPWYVLHQTLTVWAGATLSAWQLGPVIEPLLVLGLTIAGCVVLYEFAIRRVRWLHPLFGVAAAPAAPHATNLPAAASASTGSPADAVASKNGSTAT